MVSGPRMPSSQVVQVPAPPANPTAPVVTGANGNPQLSSGAASSVAQASQAEQQQDLMRKGYSSTILTSGQGVLQQPNVAKKTLLGS